MSKAIAALVRIGLESQEDRKQDFFRRLFFRRLRENLANDERVSRIDWPVNFRTLIVGR